MYYSADHSPFPAALIWQPFTECMPSTLGLHVSGRDLGSQAGGPSTSTLGTSLLVKLPGFSHCCLPSRLLTGEL